MTTSATEASTLLLRDLRSSADGLMSREAAQRLVVDGPNRLARRGGRQWPRQLAGQFLQPLALLLAVAALLAAASGSPVLAVAIAAVIVLNAGFSFLQEQHAEHAVEALASYLPPSARVLRDRAPCDVDAATLVTGDVLLIEEGDRISADARLLEGSVEIDLSSLTGESQPVLREPGDGDATVALLQSINMVFSGSACTSGEARAVVTATGMRTEIGRIASLSQRTGTDTSPLERQVRTVAKLIAIVSVVVAGGFLLLGVAAGLTTAAAISFAIGMLVANVPEGLLPTITLAMAVGVSTLAKRGAVVKRLSAVETLGSTTVICTDKTGTLTRNQMQVTDVWTSAGAATCGADGEVTWTNGNPSVCTPLLRTAVAVATRCCNATLDVSGTSGDPTEIALLQLASALAIDGQPGDVRRALFRFDPRLRLMSTLDEASGRVSIDTKGAPEAVLAACTTIATVDGAARALTTADRDQFGAAVTAYGQRGLRLIAVARRTLQPGSPAPRDRSDAERDLCLLAVIAMLDPPRPQARDAIDRAHRAGIKILVVTGDNGDTATEIARQVGIGTAPAGSRTVTGVELEAMSDPDLDALLSAPAEIVFARSSPEAKLRIAEALRSLGEVVAMTGDGVNDAPALRAADIGVAMGRSGTEVARQAATMVLTDDNFETILDAVEEGRRVYDNVGKFILYIFAHAVPEIVPFMLFALSGGSIPLPLTVMQLLAIDLITDTLPALALSREPAEPGSMDRPPRPAKEGVIHGSLLARAWGFLGVITACLVLAAFFAVLRRGGWHLNAPTGSGSPLHHVYQQATTIAWLGIVACQIGTAMAARTDRTSLHRTGFFSNPLLLGAIGVELVLVAALVYLPFLHPVFGTAAPTISQLVIVLPFPFIVWGADEARRAITRRRRRHAELLPAGASAPRPVERPDLRHALWYLVGGSLPERNWTWVLHDTTCRTWAVRELGRPLLLLAPVLAAYIAFVPGSIGLRLLTGLTWSGGVLLYLFINMLVDNDRRAVRAGYPSGTVADIRSRRSEAVHHVAVVARRERAAARRARRGSS